MQVILVTGGAGFIGSNFIRYLLQQYPDYCVINIDKLTYAGVLQNLHDLEGNDRHFFVQGDICDRRLLESLFSGSYFAEPMVHEGPHGGTAPRSGMIQAVVNFAAESHVDRSILDPEIFLKTNVYGTGVLLDVAKQYWQGLAGAEREQFRYVQISTDEVYGTLSPTDPPFAETAPMLPNSPYAAGKAGGDHVVRAYHQTYGVPVLITRCSNNYGPYQFPEKLIPLMIAHILHDRPLPVYGDGKNIRDWLHVLDHCRAIDLVWHRGRVGEVYNIGGENEWANIDIVHHLCDCVDDAVGRPRRSRQLVTFVADRLGHDRRYGLDVGKLRREFDWRARIPFGEGLQETVRWYIQHQDLWKMHVPPRPTPPRR